MMKSERGFTLVELLIVIAITGVVVSVLGTVIFQLTTVSEHGNARLTALHELQNASYWFNSDGQKSVTASGGATLTLTLPTAQTITYALSGTNLQRTADAVTNTLAQNISSVSFSVSGRSITMDITSAPAGRTQVAEQRLYRVIMRPTP